MHDMLTVHHLGISQSERIVWLCEELGLDYQLVRYERRADNRLAPDKYKALHPMGIAPVITDGDLVLSESGAICEYLCRRHGGGRLSPGPEHPDFAEHLFWFHWSNGTFMTTLMMQLVLARGGEGNPAVAFVAERSQRGWAMVEKRLGEAPFFGGAELTTADWCTASPLAGRFVELPSTHIPVSRRTSSALAPARPISARCQRPSRAWRQCLRSAH
jgi:glutathione S-transferase